jgi:hypothetical protein
VARPTALCRESLARVVMCSKESFEQISSFRIKEQAWIFWGWCVGITTVALADKAPDVAAAHWTELYFEANEPPFFGFVETPGIGVHERKERG